MIYYQYINFYSSVEKLGQQQPAPSKPSPKGKALTANGKPNDSNGFVVGKLDKRSANAAIRERDPSLRQDDKEVGSYVRSELVEQVVAMRL